MRLLKPKNINRAIVALALLAPIGYLFGTQFAALAGAHGTDVFDDDSSIVVGLRSVNYNQLLPTPDSFSSWIPFNLSLDTATGVYTSVNTANNTQLYKTVSLFGDHLYYVGAKVRNTGFSTLSLRFVNHFESFSLVSDNVYSCEYLYRVPSDVTGEFNFYGFASSNDSVSFDPLWGNLVDLTVAYGVGSEPTMSEFKRDFPSYSDSYIESEIVNFPVYGVPSYGERLMLNMFGAENFLTLIGRDAISGNPKGFAPFGHLMAFIENNMLHIGDTPIGLLGYGYLYWCAHVLIFDLLCYFMTFFIRLIKSIVDKWEVSQW